MAKYETDVRLGETYRDEHTGFEGRATAITFWENGCTRVCLEAAALKDDGTLKEAWIDEQRVEGVAPKAKAGGPRPVESSRPSLPR